MNAAKDPQRKYDGLGSAALPLPEFVPGGSASGAAPLPDVQGAAAAAEAAQLQGVQAHALPECPGNNNAQLPHSSQLPGMSEFHELILRAAGEGIYGIDPNGMTMFANPAAESMTGWKPGELIGKPQHVTIHHSHANGAHYPASSCPIYDTLQDGAVHHSESEVFWRKDGTSFPVSYTSTPIVHQGMSAGAVVIFQDITARKAREAWEAEKSRIFAAITSHQELDLTLLMIAAAGEYLLPDTSIAVLLHAGDRLRLAAQSGLPDGLRKRFSSVSIHDTDLACGRAADTGAPVAFAQSEALTETEESSCGCRELVSSEFKHCLAVPLLSSAGKVLGVVEVLNKDKASDAYPAPLAVTAICDLARLAIEHQLLHSELLRQSQHDHLTGLPNRMLLEDRLARALVNARRHGTQVAVCHLDLDHFKQINETLGHRVGDSVLRNVAGLLRGSLKEIDTVARQSGDDFILILSDLKSEAEADTACGRILATLRAPMQEGKHTITLAASIGRSMYPGNGDNGETLLHRADLALYAARHGGGNRLQAFSETLGARTQHNIELQWELRSAVERNQFHVVYQPMFNILRRLVGFEALLRWVHPVLGAINPEVFIPIAEKTGLILSIGEWVLETACRQARIWNDSSLNPIRISINVSAVQLEQAEFTSIIERALVRTGLRAELLDLEITETSLVADTGAASIRLRELRSRGVHISMDDFGCGHSSFSYLQSLPIDTIKIDRSFISPLDGTEKKSAIIRAIFSLAQQLGLQTVAEGVETVEQMQELQTTDCSLVQGYFLSRPLSTEAADQLVLEAMVPAEPAPTRLLLPRMAAVLDPAKQLD